MQDNFVGDLGDFGKYGLLRVLTGLWPVQLSDDRLSLGVVWYVPDNETIARTSSGHGQDVGYLFDGQTHQDWRGCDEALFNGLRSLVCGDRTLRAVGRSGLIGPDDAFHYQSICLPTPLAEREVKRREWLDGALQRVRSQDLIFLDPDVGMADPEAGKAPRRLSPRSQDAPQYVFMSELDEFLVTGSSVVVYQSLGRAKRGDSMRTWYEMLCNRYPERVQAEIVRFGSRAFVILPAKAHETIIDNRLQELTGDKNPWRQHFNPERGRHRGSRIGPRIGLPSEPKGHELGDSSCG